MKAAASLVAIGMVIAGATAPQSYGAGRLHVHKAHQGDVRAELTYREDGPSRYWSSSRLKIWNGRKLIVNRRVGIYATFTGRSPLAIRQLDGAGPPEVLVTLFSGGVHCCSESWVYTGAHRTVMGWGHIGAATVRDADGDGKPEFHWMDTGWAYVFSSFADSAFPAKVWSYSANAFHDVTPAFPAEVQADQAQHYRWYRDAVAEGNAGRVRARLAAYAADGYMLGQGDAAMAVVQEAIDAGETTDGDYTDDFLPVLQKALRDSGYIS